MAISLRYVVSRLSEDTSDTVDLTELIHTTPNFSGQYLRPPGEPPHPRYERLWEVDKHPVHHTQRPLLELLGHNSGFDLGQKP